MNTKKSLTVRCWGTRGSIPTPGPSTARYGGNTSCVEVLAGEERIILDAGTGIRLLGEELKAQEGPTRASIFLSHFHWDHIHGFPFFAPAYDPESEIGIWAPAPGDTTIESIFRAQMGPAHFPISYDALSAKVTFHELEECPWEGSDVRIRSMRVRHSSFTLGFRVEAFGSSVVFIPDNELRGGVYPTADDWMDRLVAFVSGADLLIHDATFTEEEYRTREGWGHSTFSQSFDLAERAGVKQLQFFHHSPHRSDQELDRIVHSFREGVRIRSLGFDIHGATEGGRIVLG